MKRKCFMMQSIIGKLCMLGLMVLCVTNVNAQEKKSINGTIRYEAEVNLNKGINEIKISGSIAGAGWLNIDYIDLSPSAK